MWSVCLSLLAPALVAAAVFPPSLSGPARRHFEFSPSEDLSAAKFESPIPKFLGIRDGALLFDLQVKPHQNVRGERNVELNRVSLSDNSGQATIPVTFKAGETESEHNLTVSWDYECLYDIYEYESKGEKEPQPIAEALLFQFQKIDGEEIFDTDSGFTVSFTQHPQAKLIRFDPRCWPTGAFTRNEWSDLSLFEISSDPLLPLWGLLDGPPPPSPSDTIPPPPSYPSLKEQMSDLKKEISNCQTLKCTLKIVMEKVRGAAKMICVKLRPPRPPPGDLGPGRGPYGKGPIGQLIWKWKHGSFTSKPSSASNSTLPSHHRFRPFHHYRHRTAISILSAATLVLILSTMIYCIHRLISSCCCTCSRTTRARRLARQREERESRRTARAYRRAARKEALRKWWRRVTQNPFFRRSIPDQQPKTQEKTHLVQTQEERLEEAMQSEIQSLMQATNMVSEMVLAEEGRARPITINNPGLRRTLSNTMSEVSLPSYRTEESEGEEPPEYEEDEEGGVADGFQYSLTRGGVGLGVDSGLGEGFNYDPNRRRAMYTPSATTWTPESSVVGSPKSEF